MFAPTSNSSSEKKSVRIYSCTRRGSPAAEPELPREICKITAILLSNIQNKIQISADHGDSFCDRRLGFLQIDRIEDPNELRRQ
jgi:hypothetical protein